MEKRPGFDLTREEVVEVYRAIDDMIAEGSPPIPDEGFPMQRGKIIVYWHPRKYPYDTPEMTKENLDQISGIISLKEPINLETMSRFFDDDED